MSTWVVTLLIEIPEDDACLNDPAAWEWFTLVNGLGEDERRLPSDYDVTVLSTKGVAADWSYRVRTEP